VFTNAIDGPADPLAAGVLRLIDDARAHSDDAPLAEDLRHRTGRWASRWAVMDLAAVGGRLLAIDPTGEDPLDGAAELASAGPDQLRVVAGPGTGSVGESVTFPDQTMRYGGMTLHPFADLPAREDLLT